MAWAKEDPKNLTVSVDEEGMVVVKFSPEENFGPSSTGKTTIVAKGTLDVPGYIGLTVSVTAWKK